MILMVLDGFNYVYLGGLSIFLNDPKSGPNKNLLVDNWHPWS